MSQVSAAGDTDVGQVRGGNEDALLVGTTVFAVADGMGGHVAGEVASETALGPVADLDGAEFDDDEAATGALTSAVQQANDHVLRLAEDDPDLRGMGTTLTVAMVVEDRLHIAHVGDSRAYLLRDGSLTQITQDHSLVQDLVDEGQISADEASSHPQRSIITRAIGIDGDLSVDATTLGLRQGDMILLCSDGLTGVVDDEAIEAGLDGAEDLDAAVATLIDRANTAGGPDNITAVAMCYDHDRMSEPAAHTTGELTPIVAPHVGTPDAAPGAAGAPETVPDGGARADHEDGTADEPADGTADEDGGVSRLQRIGAGVAVFVLLAALVVGGGRWLLGRSYYIGAAGGEVVIYQGVAVELGPVDLSWTHTRTDVPVTEVPDHIARRLDEGVTAATLTDARLIIDNWVDRGDAAGGRSTGSSPAS